MIKINNWQWELKPLLNLSCNSKVGRLEKMINSHEKYMKFDEINELPVDDRFAMECPINGLIYDWMYIA